MRFQFSTFAILAVILQIAILTCSIIVYVALNSQSKIECFYAQKMDWDRWTYVTRPDLCAASEILMILSAVVAILALALTVVNELIVTRLPTFKILFGLGFLGIIFSFASCIITQDGLDVTILYREGIDNTKAYIASRDADFGRIENGRILGWIVSGLWIFILPIFKGYEHLRELRNFEKK